MSDKIIVGKKVKLIPATMEHREMIYEWLAHSDLTSKMFGPPHFPDNLVPTWDEFIHDYTENFFKDELPLLGRCFIIKVEENPIGQINYNDIDIKEKQVELDIWLSETAQTHKGFGTDAIVTLCNYLHHRFGCERFIMAPSARNLQAIRAYEKAGFKITGETPAGFVPDYIDTIIMMKKIEKKQKQNTADKPSENELER